MAKENIPRWMTQPTPSVGSATNQLRVVTPDDLQMASQMYGQVSDRFFNIANNMGMALNYIHSDRNRILEQEGIMKAREEIESLMTNNEVVNDDKKLKAAISDIADKHTKDAGYYVGGRMRYIINNEFGLEKRMQISQNRVNIAQQTTRLTTEKDLYENFHNIFSQVGLTAEEKLAKSMQIKEMLYKNEFIFTKDMQKKADEKMQNIYNTQLWFDGRTDKILDKADIDQDYLNHVLDRHDATQKAIKLEMDFHQAQLHSEILNTGNYNYYLQNKKYLSNDQRKDIENHFDQTRGKASNISSFKSYIETQNLLNKTYDDLVELSRRDNNKLQLIFKEVEKQQRQALDNKDIITAFNSSLGLVDINSIKDKSSEEISYINKYGLDFREKIKGMQNRVISDRTEFLKDSKNSKNITESKIMYNEKKLPLLLNNMKEELRQSDINIQKKRKALLENQNKLKK